MIAVRTIPGVCIAAAVLCGCGSSEVTVQQNPPQPQAPVVQETPKRPEFETRTDTVAAVRTATRQQLGNPLRRDPQIRFMVQIGAFKDPKNASVVQTDARQRYRLPVLNDYHTKLGLYQIRIGFFETRDAAQAFRLRMRQEFPADYKDCWVVQLKR
jgi:cell division septation protein DedD